MAQALVYLGKLLPAGLCQNAQSNAHHLKILAASDGRNSCGPSSVGGKKIKLVMQIVGYSELLTSQYMPHIKNMGLL